MIIRKTIRKIPAKIHWPYGQRILVFNTISFRIVGLEGGCRDKCGKEGMENPYLIYTFEKKNGWRERQMWIEVRRSGHREEKRRKDRRSKLCKRGRKYFSGFSYI